MPRRQAAEIVPCHLRRLWTTSSDAWRWLPCRLPPIPRGTTLAELDLSGRARNFFKQNRFAQKPAAIAKLTVGDLLKTRGLGRGSIIEIVEALHRCAERRTHDWRQAAGKNAPRSAADLAPRNLRRRLSRCGSVPDRLYGHRLPPIPPGITLGDLRLTGRALRFFRQGRYLEKPEALAALTIADVLALPGMGDLAVVAIVEALYDCADPRRQNATLESEVLGWIVPRGQPERRRIVAQYYGFGRHKMRTLAALSAVQGCSHERIRQICTPDTETPAAVLRRFQMALETTSSLLPAPAAEIEARLVSDGVFEPGTKLETLWRLARLVGGETGFVVKHKGTRRLALPAPSETAIRLQSILKELARSATVVQMSHIAARWEAAGESALDAATLDQAIEATPRVEWLDRSEGWLWLDRGGASLRRRIEKALAAADRLKLAELKAAVWRGPRTKSWPQPPLPVLVELCRRLPECCVEGELIRASDPVCCRTRLSRVERELVDYLHRCGKPCPLQELHAFFDAQGTSKAMRWQILTGSPTVKRHGQSLYGTPGLEVR